MLGSSWCPVNPPLPPYTSVHRAMHSKPTHSPQPLFHCGPWGWTHLGPYSKAAQSCLCHGKDSWGEEGHTPLSPCPYPSYTTVNPQCSRWYYCALSVLQTCRQASFLSFYYAYFLWSVYFSYRLYRQAFLACFSTDSPYIFRQLEALVVHKDCVWKTQLSKSQLLYLMIIMICNIFVSPWRLFCRLLKSYCLRNRVTSPL